jgi:hypothetical protein
MITLVRKYIGCLMTQLLMMDNPLGLNIIER